MDTDMDRSSGFLAYSGKCVKFSGGERGGTRVSKAKTSGSICYVTFFVYFSTNFLIHWLFADWLGFVGPAPPGEGSVPSWDHKSSHPSAVELQHTGDKNGGSLGRYRTA